MSHVTIVNQNTCIFKSIIKPLLKKIQPTQAGFTLMEILIALLVVSVALIGVASLQMRGQQINHTAYLRTQATFLAYDIMDRMRINSNTATQYVGGFRSVGPGGEDPDYSCDGDGKTCSPTDLVNYDLNNWLSQVRETLPKGEAKIELLDNLNQEYEITLRWTRVAGHTNDNPWDEQTWILRL
jgi:type IV pilus assembly protein PilV